MMRGAASAIVINRSKNTTPVSAILFLSKTNAKFLSLISRIGILLFADK